MKLKKESRIVSECREKILVKIFLIKILIFGLLIWEGAGNISFAKTIAKIGILPFQVYSEEKVNYLQDFIPDHLAQELRKNEQFKIVNGENIKKLMAEKAEESFNQNKLNQIAQETGVHFLIYGSLTKIDENLSIDARIFSSLKESPAYKDFVEGRDLDRLIEKLGSKITQHILKVAPQIAPSQFMEKDMLVLDEKRKPISPLEGSEIIEEEISESEKPSESELKISSSSESPLDTNKALVAKARSSLPKPTPLVAETSLEETKRTSEAIKKPEKTKARTSYQPINISSDRMEADNRNRIVNFLGNVVARSEDMVIFADQISAFYTKKGKIKKIVAQGNVKINQDERTATCQMATYFQPSQKIILTGRPKVWQGSNIVSGGKITIFLNEDKISIERGKQNRVNAIIYPQEKAD